MVSLREAERLAPEESTSGAGDALELLERDHRRVDSLFARSALVMGQGRMAVVSQIVAALTAHAELEETAVYPAIARALGRAALLVDRSRAEHGEIKTLLGRLQSATSDDDALLADLRRLQLVVQAHVAVEEGEVFPAFRAEASPQMLKDLTSRVEAVMRKPSPSRREKG